MHPRPQIRGVVGGRGPPLPGGLPPARVLGNALACRGRLHLRRDDHRADAAPPRPPLVGSQGVLPRALARHRAPGLGRSRGAAPGPRARLLHAGASDMGGGAYAAAVGHLQGVPDTAVAARALAQGHLAPLGRQGASALGSGCRRAPPLGARARPCSCGRRGHPGPGARRAAAPPLLAPDQPPRPRVAAVLAGASQGEPRARPLREGRRPRHRARQALRRAGHVPV
mmetsp:Transcript_37145/g.115569  ORF Transcript_37145/g.115569 Transcript_37145/m.115569 type:complete len:226 (-) Transcript_37145:469-1146(-)